MRILRYVLGVSVILVLLTPAASIVTFLLSPLWSFIEARYGIESIGHSGPSDWCFELVYSLLAVVALLAYWRAMRRKGA